VLPKSSITVPEHLQPPVQWLPGLFHQEDMWPKHESNHLLPLTAEVNAQG